jgi:membrane protein DedA with SNARE-associated domain
MEMLESNLFQILNIEGYVVWNSPFTTIAFTKNYEINIHEDKDDDLFFHFVLAKRYF